MWIGQSDRSGAMESSLSRTWDLSSSSTTKFKIALCQLTVSSDKATNLVRARLMIQAAAQNGARLVVLPEMWVCPYSEHYFANCAEDLNAERSSPAFSMLAEVARSCGITVIGGSLPEENNGRLYNTCCAFGPDGKLIAKHRKLHLFDYYVPGDTFRESDIFTAGNAPTIIKTDVGLIGLGICHDIRFPELAMLYKARGANMVIYPAAFNLSTGEALWELEAKTRAVDNQLFVAVCSPSRASSGSYKIWGHSTLVGPDGDIKGTAGPEETTVIAEVDYFGNERAGIPIQATKEDICRFVDLG